LLALQFVYCVSPKALTMEVLDQPLIETKVRYGAFWPRVGASLIDTLVVAPVIFGVMYFNIVSWKSTGLLILANIVVIAYKPFMEYGYGATLGKMALGLRVVDLQLGQPNLNNVLLRNIFHIAGSILSLIVTVIIFNASGFEEISGYMEYAVFSQNFASLQTVNYVTSAVLLIDAIVLIADEKKRSLHDKIGGTCVTDGKPQI
jgi:uncharacterized RDD family membrane protein YckC